MTNPLNGEEIKTPSPGAVVEHVFTLPMALAAVATICGWVAASDFFAVSSSWQKLLVHISAGTPMLIAQLGQMWHSRNVRNKMAIANGAKAEPKPEVES